MEIKPTELTRIANAADYVDALTRPRMDDQKVVKRVIDGRRMRDKYLDKVTVVEVIKRPNPD
jgi:hypothetical protein